MQDLESGEQQALPPRSNVLRETIRFLAEDSRNVVITNHAEDRLIERDISDAMMFRVLRKGEIDGDISRGKKAGDWVVKITGCMLGSRDVGVVTAVVQNRQLVIITVEWEDLK